MKTFLATIASAASASLLHAAASPTLDEKVFAHPTPSYTVSTYWQWLNGNVTRAGITADLEALRASGAFHATLLDLGIGVPPGPVKEVLSPEWFDLVRHAAAEARRLQMKLGVSIHPGFSGAGGPWITPENSMKRLIWSDLLVDGGGPTDFALPPLPSGNTWSRDFAVVAWPAQRQKSPMTAARLVFNGQPVPGDRLWDGNPFTNVVCPTRPAPSWLMEFSFSEPHEADRLQLLFTERNHFSPRPDRPFTLRVREGDRVLVEQALLKEDFRRPIVVRFPATKASRFTVEISQAPGSFNFAGLLFLAEAELLRGADLAQWSGEIQDWDRQIGDGSGYAAEGGLFRADVAPPPVAPGEVRDLSAFVQDGRLKWEAPPGRWRVVRFGCTTTGKTTRPSRPGGEGLESDKMNAAATELTFRAYVQRILDAVPPDDRAVFDLVLIDSWEAMKQNWTDDFAAEFSTRRGYTLIPFAPALAGEIVASRRTTARFFNDYRQTIADLLADRFYGRARELANRAGLKLEAEIPDGKGIDPDWDIFALARAVDVPMDEFWTEVDFEAPPRAWLLADAALLAGRRIVAAEAFTGRRGDWLNTPGDFSRYAQDAFLRGINQFVLHSTPVQIGAKPPGLTMAGNGEPYTPTNTWWPMFGDWLEGVRREHYLLQATDLDAELLVYHGDTMPRPPPLTPPSFASPRRLFVDGPALLHRVTVKAGRLQLDRRGSFRALLLPRTVSLRVDVLEKIAQLVHSGATLIGPPPEYSTGLGQAEVNDRRVAELRFVIWGTTTSAAPGPNHLGRGLVFGTDDPSATLAALGFEGDVVSIARPGTARPLEYTHRRTADADVYFLVNPNDESTGFTCRVADPAARRPELWRPATGGIEALESFFHERGRVVFPLTLEARQGVFVVLRRPAGEPGARAIRRRETDGDPFSGSDGVTLHRQPGGTLSAWSDHPEDVVMENGRGVNRRIAFSAPTRIILPPPWHLAFGPLAANRTFALDVLTSWTHLPDPAARDYSGIATYENHFVLSAGLLNNLGQASLDLGEAANVARVWVNGQSAGTRWNVPWTFDVTAFVREGANTLRIEVANLWHNRLIADFKLPVSERRTATTTWAENYLRGKAPQPSGLLAPVSLELRYRQELSIDQP